MGCGATLPYNDVNDNAVVCLRAGDIVMDVARILKRPYGPEEYLGLPEPSVQKLSVKS